MLVYLNGSLPDFGIFFSLPEENRSPCSFSQRSTRLQNTYKCSRLTIHCSCLHNRWFRSRLRWFVKYRIVFHSSLISNYPSCPGFSQHRTAMQQITASPYARSSFPVKYSNKIILLSYSPWNFFSHLVVTTIRPRLEVYRYHFYNIGYRSLV